MVNGSFTAQPPSLEPVHRHMDSDKAEQHDNHVQRDDGHEQNDENPQNRPERVGELRGRSMTRSADFDTPAAFAAMPSDVYILFPRCSAQRAEHAIGTVNAWFAAHPPSPPAG